MGKKESDFSSEIWEVGLKLTTIMDRMKEKLKRKDNLRMQKCLKALAKAQGQLLKARARALPIIDAMNVTI